MNNNKDKPKTVNKVNKASKPISSKANSLTTRN